MGQQVIHKVATTTAAPDVVYELLADGSTWPGWSPLGSFELLEPGDGLPEGLGAVRRFTTGRRQSTERVVERQPGRQLSYVLLSGLPLRDYRADVLLTPETGGTTITWHSTFRSKVPGTGGLYRRALSTFIGQCVEGLASASERSLSERRGAAQP
jgi:polyketide cyclase/dehydrase/lipid transport protein